VVAADKHCMIDEKSGLPKGVLTHCVSVSPTCFFNQVAVQMFSL